MNEPIIIVAGAAGDLGRRIARALIARGAHVRALVRPGAAAKDVARLKDAVSSVAPADPASVAGMAGAVEGADCVVSALNGLRDVMIDRQGVLLDAAVRARVPRFIPSDFAADFTRTLPGRNRNFDLRRDFMARTDQAQIRVTSILNGAFLDMLGAEMPIIRPEVHRVLYWRDADQPLDFTTKDDAAAYTAAAALDPDAPRILRIAGDSVSVREIAAILTEVTSSRYRPQYSGGLGTLGAMISIAKLVVRGRKDAFPLWQGMQYMRDQFSGLAKLHPLDNGRYSGLKWRSVKEHLTDLACAGRV